MARLTFLLLLLWVGVTVSTVVDLQKRIFNGKDCPTTEHRHYVKLTNDPTGQRAVCGGSLIHKQWVLTAAHCCDSLYAVVGVHQGSGKVLKIQEKLIYFNHDIMLLKLENHNEKVTLIDLPDEEACKTSPPIGQLVRIAGYGGYLQDQNGQIKPDQPKNLQCAMMHVAVCNNALISKCRPNEPPQNWICHEKQNVDTCGGDSGGGLIHKLKLRAVHTGGGACPCSTPAFSLDVCFYKKWIEDNAK